MISRKINLAKNCVIHLLPSVYKDLCQEIGVFIKNDNFGADSGLFFGYSYLKQVSMPFFKMFSVVDWLNFIILQRLLMLLFPFYTFTNFAEGPFSLLTIFFVQNLWPYPFSGIKSLVWKSLLKLKRNLYRTKVECTYLPVHGLCRKDLKSGRIDRSFLLLSCCCCVVLLLLMLKNKAPPLFKSELETLLRWELGIQNENKELLHKAQNFGSPLSLTILLVSHRVHDLLRNFTTFSLEKWPPHQKGNLICLLPG